MSQLTDQAAHEPPRDCYPDWLKARMIEGDLPWAAALTVDLPAFLEKYTLHDSPWIGLWSSTLDTFLVVRWDTYWHRDALPFPSDDSCTWPILLIRFKRAFQFAVVPSRAWPYPMSEEVIAMATSRAVAADRREALLTLSLEQDTLTDEIRDQSLDSELLHTVLSGTFDMNVHIFHKPSVQVLCINQVREALTVPGQIDP